MLPHSTWIGRRFIQIHSCTIFLYIRERTWLRAIALLLLLLSPRQVTIHHFDKSIASSSIVHCCVAVTASPYSSTENIYELSMNWQTRNSTECAYYYLFASFYEFRGAQCHPENSPMDVIYTYIWRRRWWWTFGNCMMKSVSHITGHPITMAVLAFVVNPSGASAKFLDF